MKGEKLLLKISVTILQTLWAKPWARTTGHWQALQNEIWVIVFWVVLHKTLISSNMMAELTFAYIKLFEMLPATLFIFLILV